MVFRYEIELPFGDVKCNVLIRPKNRSALEEEENKLIEPPPNELEYISVTIEPEPISAEQQKIQDIAEEEDNKKKEHDARMQQKKLEEEKARLKYE